MNENEDKKEQSIEEKSEDFVSRKAYKEVSSDMHTYKSQLKEAKALINEMNASKQAHETAALEERQEYGKLYEQAKEENANLLNALSNKEKQFLDVAKLQAFNQMGKLKNSNYHIHINKDNISLNDDNSIDLDSVQAEFNRLKQEMPEIFNESKSGNLPNSAGNAPQGEDFAAKQYDSMDDAGKNELLKRLLQNK